MSRIGFCGAIEAVNTAHYNFSAYYVLTPVTEKYVQ